MSIINISNLTFAYEGNYDNIFENVSLQIDTNWKLGLIGRNGRGKTTLLNLLLNKYEYGGSIYAETSFEYFPYTVSDKTDLTINIIENIHPNYVHWELLREFSLLEISEDMLYQPFDTLSNGEQTKALLATLFLKENNFLLIDEPTNHLDINARKIVSNYLSTKSGFILVSHDRAFLDRCIDHVISINKSNIEIQKGNFSSWQKNKESQDNFEIEHNMKLKKEINRLEKSMREKAQWADTAERRKIGFDPTKVEKSLTRRPMESAKSKKAMKRAKAIEQRQSAAIKEKSNLLKDIEYKENLKLSPLPYISKSLIELKDICIYYGNKTACKNVRFNIEPDDRIALCGKNGSGKSSLLKLICGENLNYTGTFYKGSQLKISYVSQSTQFLKGNLSDYATDNRIDESLFKAILRKLDFKRIQFEKDISDFSEGQKKKVIIARSLCEKAHLYIWDEPLNFIDIISRIQIQELLLEYKPTILFVEHDSEFSDKVATKKVIL